MATVNPADNKKNLSKNVREMKFMQRGALQKEKDKLQAEEQLAIDAAHWCLDTSALPKREHSFILEPSYVLCGDLLYGRRSCKGFNPEIEKLCKTLDDAKPVEEVGLETSITDREMADTIGSFSRKYSKRAAKEMRQREADDYVESDGELQESPVKTKKSRKMRDEARSNPNPADIEMADVSVSKKLSKRAAKNATQRVVADGDGSSERKPVESPVKKKQKKFLKPKDEDL